MSEYCTPNDLLVGDLGGLETKKSVFITAACEEMDALIGYVYILPLSGLSVHVSLLLKDIARKLASGRLIMERAVAGEDNTVHAYGKSLVDEALQKLWMIRNGQIDLGVATVTSTSTNGNAPNIIQGDTYSGVDAFYTWISDTSPLAPVGEQIWAPGIYE